MLAVIAAGLFLTNCLALMLGPLLVEIADEFGTSVAVASQLAPATFAAWAVSVIGMGPVSDSFGRRPVALLGLRLISIGVLASAFAPNYGVLLGLRVVTGLGGGMIPPNSMAAVADSLPDSVRGRVVSWLYAVTTLANVLGIPAAVGLAAASGWRLPFLVLGAASVAVLALAWRWFPASPPAGGTGFSFFARFKRLIAIPAFRVMLLANITHRMAFFAVFGYVAAFLIKTYGIGVGETALPMAVVGLGPLPGAF